MPLNRKKENDEVFYEEENDCALWRSGDDSPLAACGTTQAGTTDEQGKTVVNVWAWDNNLKANAKVFMKKNPNIVIKFTNAGSGKDEYQALNNALEAGSGVPDIAMIEYYAIPEYAIKGSLKNLNDYGTAKYKDFYTPGTWNAVNFNGGMYGMPVDSGPMAFYYNKEVFDKAGISEAPKTWDEFYQDAKKIKQTGSYITNAPGNAGFFNAMVWQPAAIHIPRLRMVPKSPSSSLPIKGYRNSAISGRR